MHLPDAILFASDATRYVIVGAALLLLSALAMRGDRRRAKRRDIDDVGIMPWRDIAALASMGGLIVLTFGIMGWIRG
ncbi:hypothetical protein [Aurantiacibacter luteus]|uniref:Uncharacterized protein n=1 Tax=Aurantiacibacter luteus TaxID=1581420 RepID=A0A0G9N108_9SPHN|nr:hypothetical protein [Aurantiacibacter luteus]KLE35218.1 hypothetical protein AAW00_01695 [Aurantiacibacter luteus]